MFKFIIPILLKGKFRYNLTLLTTELIIRICNTLLRVSFVKFDNLNEGN